MDKKFTDSDKLIGKIVYLQCNPGIIPGGKLELRIKRSKDGKLIAYRANDPQTYDVKAWWEDLEFK